VCSLSFYRVASRMLLSVVVCCGEEEVPNPRVSCRDVHRGTSLTREHSGKIIVTGRSQDSNINNVDAGFTSAAEIIETKPVVYNYPAAELYAAECWSEHMDC